VRIHRVGALMLKHVSSMHVQVLLRVDGLLWRLRLRRRGHVQVQPVARHVREEQDGQPLRARVRGQLRRDADDGRGGGSGVTNAWRAFETLFHLIYLAKKRVRKPDRREKNNIIKKRALNGLLLDHTTRPDHTRGVI
jgi:hypothetical protein